MVQNVELTWRRYILPLRYDKCRPGIGAIVVFDGTLNFTANGNCGRRIPGTGAIMVLDRTLNFTANANPERRIPGIGPVTASDGKLNFTTNGDGGASNSTIMCF